jgi:hypothetical protein
VRRAVALLVVILVEALSVPAALAQSPPGGVQMPDPRQMSGRPLPVGDLPAGTVSVRLIRGSLDKPIRGQSVSLGSSTATTNDAGRAEFSGLQPGTRVKAVAVVDGERLESQEFSVPASGGTRLMLVATDPEAAGRAAEDQKLAQGPAQPGLVVLGDQTRFVFELGDDGLTVFSILQILNTARTPVQPQQPVVFEAPAEGEGVAILEGSSPQASLAGKRITVAGPFPPGMTLVQFAYSLPFTGDRLTVRQPVPIPLTQLTVLAQKIGEIHLTSPQMENHRDMQANGQTYILAQGPAIKAGEAVTLEFSGLPHQATWPRNLALTLAAAILGAGVWGGVRRGADLSGSRRRKLEARRDRLFAELVSIEEQHRAGALDASLYGTRRRALVSALERVYAELDEEAAA